MRFLLDSILKINKIILLMVINIFILFCIVLLIENDLRKTYGLRCSTPFQPDPISGFEPDPGCSDTTISLYQLYFININVFVSNLCGSDFNLG